MQTIFVGLKELRQNMASFATKALKKNQRMVILRKNKPIFELRPLDNESLMREEFVMDLKKRLQAAKKEKTYTQKEVMKEFGLT